MLLIANGLLGLPLWLRVALELLIFILLWRVFGKGILWILSAIPFLLDKLFILVFRIIELPIAVFHKKWGAGLHKVENGMSRLGETLDNVFMKWYSSWHGKYHFRWKRGMIVCISCWCIIVLPSLFSVHNNMLRAGEKLYLFAENKGVEWLEKHSNSDFEEEIVAEEIKQTIVQEEVAMSSEIELVVWGVKNSLLVRDIPRIEGSVTLDRLYNGDTVNWTGELMFTEINNNQVETWAKVITQNGAEGWSRFDYLCPKEYEGKRYYVKEVE